MHTFSLTIWEIQTKTAVIHTLITVQSLLPFLTPLHFFFLLHPFIFSFTIYPPPLSFLQLSFPSQSSLIPPITTIIITSLPLLVSLNLYQPPTIHFGRLHYLSLHLCNTSVFFLNHYPPSFLPFHFLYPMLLFTTLFLHSFPFNSIFFSLAFPLSLFVNPSFPFTKPPTPPSAPPFQSPLLFNPCYFNHHFFSLQLPIPSFHLYFQPNLILSCDLTCTWLTFACFSLFSNIKTCLIFFCFTANLSVIFFSLYPPCKQAN
ncbi:ATXN1_1L [Acanthosepion pharaonis]|uniref:ATXN1_1L n=1 Tax=Acanthosepion pharaonis TaxID=158019 RepID=A0A812E1J1_ACAPH|nr:ATXN1_1L [Sepia pharaonis]